MEAVLHVKGIAYCKIEIEDANMPASFNLIDHIIIHEGFGIAVPTLTLYLFDQTGTLQNDMNLVQGTKCSISIARDGHNDQIIKRTFSLWGMKRGVTNEGPHLQVVFTLDVPKWSAGVYCENFRTTSDGVMGQIARRAGLQYSGPGGTDDHMNWLNINTTRASFSEDVAMRGYANKSSCMARVLTMNSELRYKDLFAELKKDERATLLLNMDEEGVNPYPVKETQESTVSGVMAHWFNYGAIQHEHSLDNKGQQKTDRIFAPVLGDAFPISDRVKGLISDSVASRVTYTGMDTGTEPKPNSNHHQHYEKSLYQNLRSLGLFSERNKVLLTVMSDIYSFDCVRYTQRDPVGHHLIPSKSLNGKYLVAGKTIRIKNGHVYSEVLDIVRPYVSNPGESAAAGASNSGRKEQANAGPFDLTQGLDEDLPNSIEPETSRPQPVTPPKSEVENAQELMDSLEAYDQTNPAIPKKPLDNPGSMSSNSASALSQQRLRNAIAEINKTNNEVSRAIESSKTGFTPEDHHTIKRIAATAIKTSANATIEAIKRQTAETGKPPSGVEGLASSLIAEIATQVEKPVMDRYSADGLALKDKVFESVVSVVSAVRPELGSAIGDIQSGGIFEEDFQNNGLDTPVDVARDIVSAIEQEDNKGANFAFPASKFGLSANDVAIGPKDVAEFLLDYVEERKNPSQFLQDKGAEAYQAAFGTMPPTDAKEAIEQLAKSAGKVSDLFGDTELIVDAIDETKKAVTSTETDEERKERQRKQAADQLISLMPESTVKTAVQSAAGIANVSQQARDLLSRRSGDTDYSQVIDFVFGEGGVSPLVEIVKNKKRHPTAPTAEIIETVRTAISWAQYTRMGSNKAKEEGVDDEIYWEFPHAVPFDLMEEGRGEAHDLSGSTPSF